MITCNDCIHSCVCPFADGAEYRDIDNIQADCEYFVPKTESEWISVDERLPERQGAYLVFTCDKRISMCHFIDHYCDGNMQFDDYRVTHWMPLPEAPRMKGGEGK